MPNPLYDAIGRTKDSPAGKLGNMVQSFRQFKEAFNGDPQQQVQMLLDSGRMSQQQYNQLAQMASGLMEILK